GVLAETADRHGLPGAEIAIELGLRARFVLEIVQERLRRAGQPERLRPPAVLLPRADHLVARGPAIERHEHRGHVAIGHGHAQTLRGDRRPRGVLDLAVPERAPDLERLALALLLFSFDEGDYVVDHLWPGRECFTGAGDRLVRAHRELLRAKRAERVDRRHV